jgi:ribonuclease Z
VRARSAAAVFFLLAAPALATDLRITLLGTGNPRPSVERFGPSSLVEIPGEAGTRLLVDAGRGTTTRLFQVGQAPLLSGVDCVVLTHLHSDHVVGLPDLWLTAWLFGREKPLRVHGPIGTRAMTEGLKKAFAFDVRMRRDVDEKLPAKGAELEAIEVAPGRPFACGGFTVTAFRVDHGPVIPSFGYRVEAKGRAVVFSGDTRATDAVADAARGADVLVHEVASPDAERRLAQVKGKDRIERILARHTAPEDAGRIFAKAKPRLAVYSHVVPSPATAEDLVPPTRATYQGPLEVGEDLMVIEVGETVTVRRPSGREP